ncbi:hypothetical protein LG331_09685 [Vreelandella aquamarina]|uniref:hypothetical protein n=1 Tax=Vreelandella aquamarina TaxID=77097 RepID=UPI00384CF48D
MQARLMLKMDEQPVLNGRMWELGGAGWSASMNMVPAVNGHSLAARCPIGNYGQQALSVDGLNLSIKEIYLERSHSGGEAKDEWFWVVVFS